MVRIRFRVVFILLVLILLIASAIFGLLTYWLDKEPLPVSGSRWGSEILLRRVPRLGGSQVIGFRGNLLLERGWTVSRGISSVSPPLPPETVQGLAGAEVFCQEEET